MKRLEELINRLLLWFHGSGEELDFIHCEEIAEAS